MIPFGHLLGPLGAKIRPDVTFGPFWENLKFNVFLERSQYSLLFQNWFILDPIPLSLLDPFWHLFRVGTPKSLDTLKCEKKYLKRSKNASTKLRNDWYRVWDQLSKCVCFLWLFGIWYQSLRIFPMEKNTKTISNTKSREPPLAPAWWLEGKLRQSRLKCIQNSAQRLVPCMR